MAPEEKEEADPAEAKPESAPETNGDGGAEDEGPALPPASFGLFLQVMASQSLVLLGAVPNPATGKAEADLPQAKYTIDLLGVIEEKTRGNLTPEEDRLLQAVLAEARMRYVEACKS